MNDDRLDIVLLAVMLILPVSALVARRLPVGATLKMALAWVVIFAMLFVIVALWQSATATGSGLGAMFQ